MADGVSGAEGYLAGEHDEAVLQHHLLAQDLPQLPVRLRQRERGLVLRLPLQQGEAGREDEEDHAPEEEEPAQRHHPSLRRGRSQVGVAEVLGLQREQHHEPHEVARRLPHRVAGGGVSHELGVQQRERPPVHCDVLGGGEEVDQEEAAGERGDAELHGTPVPAHLPAEEDEHGPQQQLHRNQPRLPPAYAPDVQNVHDRRPQQLDAEGPVHEGEEGLLAVRDVPRREDHGDRGGNAEGDALQEVEAEEEGDIPQLSGIHQTRVCVFGIL